MVPIHPCEPTQKVHWCEMQKERKAVYDSLLYYKSSNENQQEKQEDYIVWIEFEVDQHVGDQVSDAKVQQKNQWSVKLQQVQKKIEGGITPDDKTLMKNLIGSLVLNDITMRVKRNDTIVI